MPLFPGVYTRALHELFAVVDQREQTHKYHMKVSMVEIYNEAIRDLLCEEQVAVKQAKTRGSTKGLAIQKGEHGNEVVGATHLPVNCPDDIHYIMERGQKNRSTGCTKGKRLVVNACCRCLLLMLVVGACCRCLLLLLVADACFPKCIVGTVFVDMF